ncbi:MAG: glycoside hydrolase family 57 protein [Elusimicrobiota bacterium]
MKKIHLAFLWHQHQPMYKNPGTGVYELPWVRLHAVKDYYDTAAILDEFPKIKSNFNLVPSLLFQLDEYAKGVARDKFMDLTLKSAEELSQDERIFILHNFFMANWDTMVHPYPRYLQLLEKRGRQTSPEELKRIQNYFKAQDMRDLQVWFNLAWMDPYWKERDALVKSLYEKGKNFTEEEKHQLISKQLEICGMIVGKYKELQDKGQIEISTTPFYHPILPLLSDTNNTLVSTPQMPLPKNRFKHPEDAQTHVRKAVEYYTQCFGRPPRGMWPAEGSVSEDVLPIFEQAGIKWIATDEEILFRTLPEYRKTRQILYQAYSVKTDGSHINIIFRDHGLSDAFGFVYQKWDAKHAVADFMKNLHNIRDHLDFVSVPNQQFLVSVILDGENCWEYYPNDGWDFLRLLYKTLSEDETVETVTISDFLEKNPPSAELSKLFAGSWINADYGIWIGHSEDNLAWDYLFDARKFLDEYTSAHPDKKDSDKIKAAWEKLYIAEGSDWNWWYGDDHSSGNDEMFDFLFRQNLINIYESLGESAPLHLFKAIKEIAVKKPITEPLDFITPKIDGKVTNYFEWQAAGSYQVGHTGGSMHQVATVLKSFHFGFDLENIYLRFDLNNPLNEIALQDFAFRIFFFLPPGREALLSFKQEGEINEFILKTPFGHENLTSCACNKIIELAIPLSKLQIEPEFVIFEFVIVVLKNGSELERWPSHTSVVIPKPTPDFQLKNWSV